MPTLAGFDGRSLTSNLGAQLGQGAQVMGQLGQNQFNQEKLAALQGQQTAQAQMQAERQALSENYTPEAAAQFGIKYPGEFEKISQSMGLVDQNKRDEAARFALEAAGSDPVTRSRLIQERAANLAEAGRNASDTVSLLDMPYDEQTKALELTQMAALTPQKWLELKNKTRDDAATRNFTAMTKGLDEADIEKARRIELGLDPRATGSADITAATIEGLTKRVAESKAMIEGAKQEAKLTEDLEFKPQIQSAVKLAEAEATARGETLTALKRSEAALPGLTEAVNQLKDLAPIATSTIGGKIFDQAVKQTGFGATEGATARAKFVAIVNNQVLPLLRETFGAAFTAQEGESLKATMGDPDASPAEKMVQLDAFIAQKYRDIGTKSREVAPQPSAVDPALMEFMTPEERALFNGS
jgi:hypothetical protein